MNSVSTLAYVLKTQPYKEKDRLVFAYTKEFGRMTLIAKGVNKMESKNASSLQELSLVEVMMIPKKGISTLLKASNVEFYRHIKEDLTLQVYASYIMEYIYKSELENKPSEKLFDSLYKAMKSLNEGTSFLLIYSLFNLEMLERNGITIEVDRCAKCKEIKPILSINVYEGGFICQECMGHKDTLFSKEVLRLLRHMRHYKLEYMEKISYDEEDLKQVSRIVEVFVEEYSGLYFQTKKFMLH